MKRVTALATLVVFCTLCPAYAIWEISNKGTWSKDWPEELEPLRKQARSLTGPFNQTIYEIPFTKREDFKSAWPYILNVKSKGAPLVLVRGPDEGMGARMTAGVRIHCPPPQPENGESPPAPLPGATTVRGRWLWTTFIELVVDGNIVDLNGILLPGDTPIVDMRFEERDDNARDRNRAATREVNRQEGDVQPCVGYSAGNSGSERPGEARRHLATVSFRVHDVPIRICR
jgi:hypothetical protein